MWTVRAVLTLGEEPWTVRKKYRFVVLLSKGPGRTVITVDYDNEKANIMHFSVPTQMH